MLVRALIHTRVDYCNGLLAAGPKYLHEKLQSVLPAAARLVLQLPYRASVSDIMRQQYTGSRCQITSDSNCVRWNTNAYTDSLLTICPISARPPRCTLIWDHLWRLNGRCLFPGRKRKPRRLVRADSTLLRPQPGTHSQCICATLNFRWAVLNQNWKLTFFLDITHLVDTLSCYFCSSCAPTR